MAANSRSNGANVSVRLFRGEKSITVSLDDLEVRKIAAVFRLKPSSLYLAEEFDNMVLFPHEQSGRFNKQQINSRCAYEVHGDDAPASVTPTSHGLPFGGYTSPSCHLHGTPSTLPPPHPPTFSAAGRKKSTFRKTIVLVSLTSTDRPCSSKSPGISYTIVTQIVVTLEPHNCSPGIVAGLVKQQVGYEVILLDSKCFPVLDNDTSRSMEYWKSTRKILAASLSLYTRLKGTSADPERAKVEIDLTAEVEGIPKAKRACRSQCDSADGKLDQIIEGLDKLDQAMGRLDGLEQIDTRLGRLEDQLSFATVLTDVFECVVCKSVSKKPVTAPCCCRVVGCEECVQQWVCNNNTCPLCSSEATAHLFSELKGFDQALLMASQLEKLPDSRAPSGREANSPSDHPYHVPSPPQFESDDSDFEQAN